MNDASPKVSEPSMEEILASIRRIIADDQDGPRAAAPAPLTPASPARRDDVLDFPELKPARSATPALGFEPDEVSIHEAEEPSEFDPLAAEDDEEPPPVVPPAPAIAPAPAAAAAPPRARSPEPDALLSGAAQATTASAFQMLSTTVLNSNPRTLEDLVKEMLRPMLKAWLDDNLPPLVERLVRAEIERVARSGR